MKTYRAGNVPDDAKQLPSCVRRELLAIEKAANTAEPFLFLKELHAEPSRVFTGLCVLADGTDWDPGSGAGVYAYYGGAWHLLG